MDQKKLDMSASRLKMISAVAEVTAEDLQSGKLWDGEFDRRLAQIQEQLRMIRGSDDI